MTEPDVALTDYALALECTLFVALLSGRGARHRDRQAWFVVFFASVGAASLFGGTVHGFFLDEQTRGQAVLWPATLLAVGVTALAAWVIGAKLLFGRQVVTWVMIAALAQFAVYSVIVFLGMTEFWIAILDYLPAACFLLVALAILYRRERHAGLALAVGGLALTITAASLQQCKVALHPVYFNHNALYHVLQALALFLLFLGSRWLVGASRE